jgi:hypothetical protein
MLLPGHKVDDKTEILENAYYIQFDKPFERQLQ